MYYQSIFDEKQLKMEKKDLHKNEHKSIKILRKTLTLKTYSYIILKDDQQSLNKKGDVNLL